MLYQPSGLRYRPFWQASQARVHLKQFSSVSKPIRFLLIPVSTHKVSTSLGVFSPFLERVKTWSKKFYTKSCETLSIIESSPKLQGLLNVWCAGTCSEMWSNFASISAKGWLSDDSSILGWRSPVDSVHTVSLPSPCLPKSVHMHLCTKRM